MKDFGTFNKLIKILESVSTALNSKQTDKCLNLIINAKGLLETVKTLELDNINSEILIIRKELSKQLKEEGMLE